MLFNTLQFALFFLVVAFAVRALPARAESKLLLGASLVFYASWYPAYLLLLLAEVGLNFLWLRGIQGGTRKGLFLWLSVVTCLVPLAVVKYAGLAMETWNAATSLFGTAALPVPDFFLPLGISFFSFQMLSLAIDAHRGSETEAPGFGRYLLYVSFFPQLIAGPILRGRELLPQLARGGVRTRERDRRGIWLIASGLVKKVILADFLIAPFVDDVFGSIGGPPRAYYWVAAYAFTFQIYYDFSGYCDIARGVALLLGYELPLNFREPFLSRNPSEFWRRWHITLSQWLRDYLYIPLGGNRGTSIATYRNLVITMLLGGLWHGATWNFVLWGGLHGIWLAVHRLLARGRRDVDGPLVRGDGLKVFASFHIVVLLFVVFRAPDFGTLVSFGRMAFLGVSGWPVLQFGIVLACGLLHGLERAVRTRWLEDWRRGAETHWAVAALEAVVLGLILGLVVLTSGGGGAFIYFQF